MNRKDRQKLAAIGRKHVKETRHDALLSQYNTGPSLRDQAIMCGYIPSRTPEAQAYRQALLTKYQNGR
jgi:hypothetical protein